MARIASDAIVERLADCGVDTGAWFVHHEQAAAFMARQREGGSKATIASELFKDQIVQLKA